MTIQSILTEKNNRRGA